MPEYARDVDLLVFTRKTKGDYADYLDCLDRLNLPFQVELVIRSIDEGIGNILLTPYKLLHGKGRIMRRLVEDIKWKTREALGLNPIFDEAYDYIRTANEDFELWKKTKLWTRICSAFNNLFHASRIASMIYLRTSETRWGILRKELPKPYKREFSTFAKILHIKYFYQKEYPRENIEKEFDKWRKRVEDYVKSLEEAIKESV
jgi:hypothetical protein